MGKVLITGGNGFVATHVVLQALEAGYHVVSTVRSTAKAADSDESIPQKYKSNITYAVVADAGQKGAFDQVIKDHPDMDGVIHTATPFHYNIENPHELYDPAVIGTEAVLQAAHDFGSNIKRVVILSSFASIVDRSKGSWPDHTYTEADWNPITRETALAGDKSEAYYGAKTWAEKAAWSFVEQTKPKFSIATICPPFIWGAVLNKVTDVKKLGTSNALLYSFIDGSIAGGEIPPNPDKIFLFVNVKNVAQALMAGYIRPEAANERFLITSGLFTNKEIVDIFQKLYPDRADKVPITLGKDLKDDGFPKEGIYAVDNSKSVKLLGIKYSTLEETVQEFMESIKSIDKA